MAKPPSMTKIEIGELALRDLLSADLPADLRAKMLEVRDGITALRRSDLDPADHRPVYLDSSLYPGAMQQIGCSCGNSPKTPMRGRYSTMHANYHSHLATIGLPRSTYPTTYASGPYAGLTYEQKAQVRTALSGHGA